jgi:hypothetical protein
VQGSQASPLSTTLFPQIGKQSSSLFAWQLAGQQPSPERQEIMGTLSQIGSQFSVTEIKSSIVQALLSLQFTEHFSESSVISDSELGIMSESAESSTFSVESVVTFVSTSLSVSVSVSVSVSISVFDSEPALLSVFASVSVPVSAFSSEMISASVLVTSLESVPLL